MTSLEILDAKIARARSYFRAKTHLDYLNSAREILDASAHCGQGVTLNENQCRALAIFLESQAALREVRHLQRPEPALNIIPFASQN